MGYIRTTIMTTKMGKIRGISRTSEYSGQRYYSFLGIPYAKPPTGDRRFKPPEPQGEWSGILDATVEKDDCIQFSCYEYKHVGSENCLYLNIHLPQVNEFPKIIQRKPVIVMIHGGALLWGSGATNVNGSPEYIMHQDVIYVTLNFRLHILGFLNLNLPECPGNVGLKDIVMALHWIQENIIYFGGDPHNVTLIGYSSGAIIIHALMLSPITKGLFHKVIMMGMYMFHPFIVFEEHPLDVAFAFGKRLGFTGNDRIQLLKFLKKQPLQTLLVELKNQTDYADTEYKKLNPSSPFVMSIETIEKGAFITKSPVELMEMIPSVPVIFGCCEIENVFALLYGFERIRENDYRSIYRQNIYSWLHKLNDGTLSEMENQIEIYYNERRKNENYVTTALKKQQDVMMMDFYHTVANLLINKSLSANVYVYVFEYEGDLNWSSNKLKPFLPFYVKGTVHSDDIHYWMCKNTKPNASDSRIIQTVTKLFTNFARTGNPNDEELKIIWKATNSQDSYYLRIGEKVLLSQGRPGEERLLFWEKLKKSYLRSGK